MLSYLWKAVDEPKTSNIDHSNQVPDPQKNLKIDCNEIVSNLDFTTQKSILI